MADPDDPADAAARLEQALERIAALSLRTHASVAPTTEAPRPAVPTTEIASRLDHLIARIRASLDHPSEG